MNQFPCEECGKMVDLDRLITVSDVDTDGSEVHTTMSEFDARALLDELGIPRPPVLCANEERMDIQMGAAV